jgi:large subunit ribosomal protein L24
MQKLLQRAAQAKHQAARRAAKRASKNAAAHRKRAELTEIIVRRQMADDVRAARQARHENRLYGPLAPRRDVGEARLTYGAMEGRRLGDPSAKTTKKKPEEGMRGDAQPIVPRDRVVITEGRDRGRIGTVLNVDRKKQECTVQGLNQV